MQFEINPDNIDDRKTDAVVRILKQDGVIILPTDTVYAFACSIYSEKAIEKICRFKQVKVEKANLSFLFNNLKNISEYTKPFDRSVYKLLNRSLPGPFTFILEASSKIPAIFRSRKKTIGIRIPDHPVALAIIEKIGHPLIAASLHDSDDPIMEYLTDPNEIFEKFESITDAFVDCGVGGNKASTVVDLTGNEVVVLREGKGILS
ncbi:MAG: threonylcarbamoyl-AMP synthase [Bacteroidetes bacterium]|jgi:tRNA threonylcarbamoyl adenosine modification protein (Sua5/YciO/YrdC/YwlC family)|nr:threonylcarbamoyl-AMP synthase [Bacteroidota bacterium]